MFLLHVLNYFNNIRSMQNYFQQDNHALLKEIFHRIDPSSVSGFYGKVLGEIEVSMKYKSNESTLLVKIGRAKNLQCPDVHKLPNPFVQVQLIVKRYFYF